MINLATEIFEETNFTVSAVGAVRGNRGWHQHSVSHRVPEAQRRPHTRESGQPLRQAVPETEPSQPGPGRPAQTVPKPAVHLGRSHAGQGVDLECVQ